MPLNGWFEEDMELIKGIVLPQLHGELRAVLIDHQIARAEIGNGSCERRLKIGSFG